MAKVNDRAAKAATSRKWAVEKKQHIQFFRKLRRLVYEFKREELEFAEESSGQPNSRGGGGLDLGSEEERGRTLTHITGLGDLYVTVQFLSPNSDQQT